MEDTLEARVNMAKRAIWKGSISFGLVYIPVQLHSATHSSAIDLDMLDRHDFSPVGYQRINKRTGKVVEWADIVKGYQHKKGQYVALSDEDFRQANVKATQTIEIASFTDAASIPQVFFDTPYYLSPAKGGAKVYALLREALKRTGKIAVATFVMRGKQHLATVYPFENALVLNTLRFADDIAGTKEIDVPSATLQAKEISMAERLVEEMAGPWKPEAFEDTYRHDLMKRIEEKIRKHQTHTLTPASKEREPGQSAQVIDLMAVLKKSLDESGKGTGRGSRRAPRRVTGRSSARRGKRSQSTARSRRRA
jgi:DNA end-binding protein Ku